MTTLEALVFHTGLLALIVIITLASTAASQRPAAPAGKSKLNTRGFLNILAVAFAGCAFVAAAWQGWVAARFRKTTIASICSGRC